MGWGPQESRHPVTRANVCPGNTTASGATTQTYNIFDQFTSNTSGGTTTNYTYNGPRNDSRLTAGATAFLNGSLGITQQTTAGATTSFIRDPNGNPISMRTSTGASFYYTMDGLGSTILLTDSAQAAAAAYSYDSWGNTTSSGAQAAANPWTYAGGYNDTTNNRIKFGARYYNPFRGRFTQADPSGQEPNPYQYVGDNPLNATDESGLLAAGCYQTDYGIQCPLPSQGNFGTYGPSDQNSTKCRVSLGFSFLGVFLPGIDLFAFAGVFVAAATC
ncbi:RHS repeat-associated core domain-containing protein [Arthrobacter sp. KN11-1C]|uniref:RHS repeat-associated core domain-containing protein n=1 Tax=Arthrobacter sp. KN11-1C TaxID=3445774 RepID=UPI003F9EDD98